MIRRQAQRSSIGWVGLALVAVLAAALLVQLVYEIWLGIPARARSEQETTAALVLRRISAAIASHQAQDHPASVDALIAREASAPRILAWTLLDHSGSVVASSSLPHATSPLTSAPLVVPETLWAAAIGGPREPRFGESASPPRLFAALALGEREDADTSTSNTAAGGRVLVLTMDLAAARHDELRRLFSWSGIVPWVSAIALVALLLGLARRPPDPRADALAVSDASTARLLQSEPQPALSWAAGADGRIGDLDHILEIAAVLLVGLDRDGQVRYVNRKVCQLLGLERDQIVGRDWIGSFVPESEREGMRRALRQVIDDGAAPLTAVECAVLCADGSERLIEWNNSRIHDASGQIVGGLGSGTDITERKQAERALSYLVTLETVLVETSRSLVAAPADAVGPLVDNALGTVARRMGAERAYVMLLSRDGLTMRNAHEWSASGLWLGPQGSQAASTSLIPRWIETLQHGDDIRIDDVAKLPETWRLDREQLEQLEVQAVAAVAIRVAGRLAGFVAVEMLSMTRAWRDSEMRALGFLGDLIGGAFERRRNELKLLDSRRRLEEIALYDPLTRLPNRRLLAERMEEAVAQAREHGLLLGVCYLDLDGFKPINDTHGHKMGDRVLVTVASRLRACVREDDTVSRLGGDEFVLLMNRLESLSDCAEMIDRVLAALAQPILIDGHSLAVTGSAGVTLFPQDPGDADTLLRHADQAMYQAKQQGRDRFQLFKAVPEQTDQADQRELSRMREAILGDELRLHVQPRVNMRSGEVVGVEALVRWQHPERGLLPPGEFLPMMEGDELIHDLDWWVMETALGLLGQWQDAGLSLTLSLNLSACSLQEPGFVATLQEVLARHPTIDPRRLLFEVVESEAMRDLETTAAVIRACAILGVHFALDGFGNGYASLTDFRCLPAHVVKIDQSVVRDILRSRDDRNLVQGVIGIANAFQREVIAEGVESAAHGLLLMDLGCSLAQGFGIADPMPPERLIDWIEGVRMPRLWMDRPHIDWERCDLALLGSEAAHRAWANRVMRYVYSDGVSKAPESDPAASVFGRWYMGDGQVRYGDLEAFRCLAPLHEAAHEQGRLVLEMSRLDRDAIGEAIAELIVRRDRLVEAIRALQAEVIGSTQTPGNAAA